MTRSISAWVVAVASLATGCGSTSNEGAPGDEDSGGDGPMRPAVEVTRPDTSGRGDVAERLPARVAPRGAIGDAVSCPDGAPFVCPARSARGYECRERACPPSCERVGCPGTLRCIDCGGGAECAPRDHVCR